MDLTADYWALRNEAGAARAPRDFLRVTGPESLAFLQGQLSQDVEHLGPGASAYSFLLHPQGKVVALLRVTKLAEDEFVLDTDAGWRDSVAERLDRFKLRVKCDIEPLDWRCLAVRGPRAADVAVENGVRVDAAWPGIAGFDVLGEDPRISADVRTCDSDALDAVRIESGIPRMGTEVDERTIPAETGFVDRAVSFTKGCYTGQELVARIESRGSNTPRRLRGVVIGTNVLPPVGAAVFAGENDVGTLTSVAESMTRKAPVALAYIRRAVEPPAEATVRFDGGEAVARIEELPLVQ